MKSSTNAINATIYCDQDCIRFENRHFGELPFQKNVLTMFDSRYLVPTGREAFSKTPNYNDLDSFL